VVLWEIPVIESMVWIVVVVSDQRLQVNIPFLDDDILPAVLDGILVISIAGMTVNRCVRASEL